MRNEPIKTLKRLRQLAGRDGGLNCYTVSRDGSTSSKHIVYQGDNTWSIRHSADGSEQNGLMSKHILHIIGKAIKTGCLVSED